LGVLINKIKKPKNIEKYHNTTKGPETFGNNGYNVIREGVNDETDECGDECVM